MRSTAPSPVEIFKMKLFLLTVSLSVICYGANAQASECSMVPKSSDRLACYDRVTPPSSAKPAVTSKQKKLYPGPLIRKPLLTRSPSKTQNLMQS